MILKKIWTIKFLKEQWTKTWGPSCAIPVSSQGSPRAETGFPWTPWVEGALRVCMYCFTLQIMGISVELGVSAPFFRAWSGIAGAADLSWDWNSGNKSYIS